jgi:hypothetical protein
MKHAAPRLQRATVAAEDGSSVVSESRKAQQAAYMMEHDPNEKDDPLNELYARIFSMTNFHSNYNLKIQGQEGTTMTDMMCTHTHTHTFVLLRLTSA